jgi:hypothetical protein
MIGNDLFGGGFLLTGAASPAAASAGEADNRRKLL